MPDVVFFDTEVFVDKEIISDIGAVKSDGGVFHSASVKDFISFVEGADFLCGHNIIHHDLHYLDKDAQLISRYGMIDTLYLSPLLFPKNPYHSLVKDDKIVSDELNNPVNDSRKAQSLFFDEVNAFLALPPQLKRIFCCLLYRFPEFKGFFDYLNFKPFETDVPKLISSLFKGRICENARLEPVVSQYPQELAYALALINIADTRSITPKWLVMQYPRIENILRYLRNTPCEQGCDYCRKNLEIHSSLKQIFGFESFRTYDGEPLQEKAAQAAVEGKSLLAVFPTGGGKSVTFQLPALMAGKTVRGLTVVISPLQSLMKDQVDNLNEKGITEAVTINGLLDPVERANAINRVEDGSASLLYISPEQLRSATIERMLLSRNVVRFVIDEAHCFSAWGQDFRVDYLYIGDFIKYLQEQRLDKRPIPVSCFTATAKQKVITDICDYFKEKLGLDFEIFASTAARENLHYAVQFKETDGDKYDALRDLINRKNCPTIVYVSRVRQSEEIAERLTSDGFKARPFNGQMNPDEKIETQDAFINNDVRIIVATSAFGMGVDKKDVGLVVHFDISDSLENYIQEAGRAGRDPGMQADCYVLYNEKDLDKHFQLLNQTKLSMSEIQQIWKAIKDFTRNRSVITCSALELARQAGWDDSVRDIETRVRTAVAALENSGYIKRGRNVPHVYATGIKVNNMEEAAYSIQNSDLFNEDQKEKARRIIQSLISSKSIAEAGNAGAESRVDYIADRLGLTMDEIIDLIDRMRLEGILDDAQDMNAYILANDTENRSMLILRRFARLEEFFMDQISDDGLEGSLKEINDAALNSGVTNSSVKDLRTILYYLMITSQLKKEEDAFTGYIGIKPVMTMAQLREKLRRRIEICRFIIEELYSCPVEGRKTDNEQRAVQFSLVGLYKRFNESQTDLFRDYKATIRDVQHALLYLSKIGAMKIDGGFLVLYNGMEIRRVELDNKIKYKASDYRLLNEFYKQKIQQIHIVGEYANLMVRDYDAAMQYVQDYFQMDYRRFISKYFSENRSEEIEMNMTKSRYEMLFGNLSEIQREIISDSSSKYIVVAAGPGSGKTRVLVHKLASLLLMEDVKHEQLLMLTFSRAAASVFWKQLYDLIQNAAGYIEIKTFHSYCFDLLGKIGNLEDSQDIVKKAADLIESGEVERGKITKSVLVIDEAQDMDENEFRLVQALISQNEDMRVIAVGDDDQNIYEFRGSDSKYLRRLITEYNAKVYEMTENFRSSRSVVSASNWFVTCIKDRMKNEPIRAVTSDYGSVTVTDHTCKSMIVPLIDELQRNRNNGSTCVLTNTNEEALKVLGVLRERGIRARLIQSLDGFRLKDLVEIRALLKYIDKRLSSPKISDELWSAAREYLKSNYATSTCLENCLNLMDTYETVSKDKYRSDFDEFIFESGYDDFYSEDKSEVFVSTIHKAKGREFDNVFLLLCGNELTTEEKKRVIYVGMTRAKSNLFIHNDTGLFRNADNGNIIVIYDNREYEEPHKLTLQMNYRDVHLDYFKDRRNDIFKLRSGDPLTVDGDFLSAVINGKNNRLVHFSKSFIQLTEDLKTAGYNPHSAVVRFIVAWKKKDETQENPIILADLEFVREGSSGNNDNDFLKELQRMLDMKIEAFESVVDMEEKKN